MWRGCMGSVGAILPGSIFGREATSSRPTVETKRWFAITIIHGNRTEHVPEAYRRYLVGVYRKRLNLWGTPIQVEFRGGENPYRPAAGGRPRPKPDERRKTGRC